MDVPVELSRIMITELGDQQVIFLKEKDGDRNFPIMIGTREAMAIDRRLKGHKTPRPMTHDLMADVIESMGGSIERILISDIQDHTFIAKLYISRGEETIEIDSRPSDAIALGVAYDTDIYVAEHVLDTVFNESSTQADRVELLRKRLDMLGRRINELTRRLADQEFLTGNSEEVVESARRHLDEMKTEYEAIDQVLKKLG